MLEFALQVLWWDTRKLGEPTEKLVMDPSKKGKMENAQGVIALEYEPTIVSIGLLFTSLQHSI